MLLDLLLEDDYAKMEVKNCKNGTWLAHYKSIQKMPKIEDNFPKGITILSSEPIFCLRFWWCFS